MNLIFTLIAALIAIFSVIIIHEYGHFLVAKWCGVRVLRFSIGFGKALWSWRSKAGTEYILAMIPLGGYVKMLGEDDKVTSPDEMRYAYHKKSIWARIAIVIAGPLTNIILAVILFWCVFLMGVVHLKPVIGTVTPGSIAAKAQIQPGDEIVKIGSQNVYSWQRVVTALVMHIGDHDDLTITVKPKDQQELKTLKLSLQDWRIDPKKPVLLESLGITPFQPKISPLIGKVMKNSPAERAGLQKGDRILSIDGSAISDWSDMAKFTSGKQNQKLIMIIQRGSQKITVPVLLSQQGVLGVYSPPAVWPQGMLQHLHFNALTAWSPAFMEMWSIISFNAVVLVKLVLGKVSLRTLGGPIMIFQTAGQASKIGLNAYLAFVAFISTTLGFINLLPIPGLDGGHLLFHIIEAIKGKPLSENAQRISIIIGFVFLIFLMLQATLNDIMRLF